jgi:hypothetical protein
MPLTSCLGINSNWKLKVWPFFFYTKEKCDMNTNRDQNTKNEQQAGQAHDQQEKQHSSAFKETSRGDEKSTTNVEEEADLEQERKEAMTERD